MEYPVINSLILAYVSNEWTGLDIETSISIGYTQSGSGDPSPDNVRTILPGAIVNINNTDIPVVGGTVDLSAKTLTLTKGFDVLNGSETWTKPDITSARNYLMRSSKNNIKFTDGSTLTFVSNYLPCIPESATFGNYDYFISSVTNNDISCGIRSIESVDAWKSYLAEHNLEIVYDYITPVVYILTDSELLQFMENAPDDISHLLKLPINKYPHSLITALQRAAAGTQTADDTEILRHYLTPLGIGGI